MLREMSLKMVLRWTILRSLSRSPIGNMTFLVPFLPFFVDFLNYITVLSKRLSLNDSLPALIHWIETNSQTFRLLYVGLIFFLIAKLSFEILAPDHIRRYEDAPDMRRKLMEDKRVALEVGENDYAAHISRRLSRALADMLTQDSSQVVKRAFVSFLFFVAFFLIFISPLGNFIHIMYALYANYM